MPLPLILGSQSPRRIEILSHFSLPFEQVTSHFDERSVPFQGNPVSYASQIAVGKAEALNVDYPDRKILTADTVVYRQGKIYGKPQDENDAIATLRELVGQWHSVFTALTLQWGTQQFTRSEETRVLFNPLSEEQIKTYHRELHLYDKAGSYQLQMPGGLIVSRIEGCYYNVVGLPINSLRSVLKEVGIELWDHLRNRA